MQFSSAGSHFSRARSPFSELLISFRPRHGSCSQEECGGDFLCCRGCGPAGRRSGEERPGATEGQLQQMRPRGRGAGWSCTGHGGGRSWWRGGPGETGPWPPSGSGRGGRGRGSGGRGGHQDVAPPPPPAKVAPPPSALPAVVKLEDGVPTAASVVDFFVLLYAEDWHQRLRLPERFAAGVWATLEPKVLLKLSDEEQAWEVSVRYGATREDCFLTRDWSTFADNHGFEQGWMLRFHHYSEGFVIRTYDGTMCRRYYGRHVEAP